MVDIPYELRKVPFDCLSISFSCLAGILDTEICRVKNNDDDNRSGGYFHGFSDGDITEEGEGDKIEAEFVRPWGGSKNRREIFEDILGSRNYWDLDGSGNGWEVTTEPGGVVATGRASVEESDGDVMVTIDPAEDACTGASKIIINLEDGKILNLEPFKEFAELNLKKGDWVFCVFSGFDTIKTPIAILDGKSGDVAPIMEKDTPNYTLLFKQAKDICLHVYLTYSNSTFFNNLKHKMDSATLR